MSEQRVLRRYGQCSGNERGIPENVLLCVEEVSSQGSWHYHQCSRKRGQGPDGLYCKQHAKGKAGRMLHEH